MISQWPCYWVFQIGERAVTPRILVLVLAFVVVLFPGFVLGLVVAVLLYYSSSSFLLLPFLLQLFPFLGGKMGDPEPTLSPLLKQTMRS